MAAGKRINTRYDFASYTIKHSNDFVDVGINGAFS